jgi:hypothetical protein
MGAAYIPFPGKQGGDVPRFQLCDDAGEVRFDAGDDLGFNTFFFFFMTCGFGRECLPIRVPGKEFDYDYTLACRHHALIVAKDLHLQVIYFFTGDGYWFI